MVAEGSIADGPSLEEKLSEVVKKIEASKSPRSSSNFVHTEALNHHFLDLAPLVQIESHSSTVVEDEDRRCCGNFIQKNCNSKQAIPLSAAAVKPFGLVTTPISISPETIVSTNVSPISSPSTAGIHSPLLHSPRNCFPSNSPESPLHLSPKRSKIGNNKARSKRVTTKTAPHFKTNAEEFRSLVEQLTGKPDSPRAPAAQASFQLLPGSSSAPPLLDSYHSPQPAMDAAAALALLSQTLNPPSPDVVFLQTTAAMSITQNNCLNLQEDTNYRSISFNLRPAASELEFGLCSEDDIDYWFCKDDAEWN